MKPTEQLIREKRTEIDNRTSDLKAKLLTQHLPLSDRGRVEKARIQLADVVAKAFDDGGDIPIFWLKEVAETLAIDLPY